MIEKPHSQAACAYSSDIITIATLPDSKWRASPFSPGSLLSFGVRGRTPIFESEEWNLNIVSISRYTMPNSGRKVQVFLSAEGHVSVIGKGVDAIEKIPGAGLFSDDSHGAGYMSSIRQIGDTLYAVGDGGQIYTKVGTGLWESDNEFLDISSREKRDFDIIDVAGNSEHTYICSRKAGAFIKKNGVWCSIPATIGKTAYSAFMDQAGLLWIGGADGCVQTIRRDGHVANLRAAGTNRPILDVVEYDGVIYLSTSLGLYTYNGTSFFKVFAEGGETEDGYILDVSEGVLWSVGYNSILRYDGTTWERTSLPDLTK